MSVVMSCGIAMDTKLVKIQVLERDQESEITKKSLVYSPINAYYTYCSLTAH